jgi:hypothetical protein
MMKKTSDSLEEMMRRSKGDVGQDILLPVGGILGALLGSRFKIAPIKAGLLGGLMGAAGGGYLGRLLGERSGGAEFGALQQQMADRVLRQQLAEQGWIKGATLRHGLLKSSEELDPIQILRAQHMQELHDQKLQQNDEMHGLKVQQMLPPPTTPLQNPQLQEIKNLQQLSKMQTRRPRAELLDKISSTDKKEDEWLKYLPFLDDVVLLGAASLFKKNVPKVAGVKNMKKTAQQLAKEVLYKVASMVDMTPEQKKEFRNEMLAGGTSAGALAGLGVGGLLMPGGNIKGTILRSLLGTLGGAGIGAGMGLLSGREKQVEEEELPYLQPGKSVPLGLGIGVGSGLGTLGGMALLRKALDPISRGNYRQGVPLGILAGLALGTLPTVGGVLGGSVGASRADAKKS